MDVYPNRQQFAEQLGSSFRVSITERGILELTLAEVNELGSRESDGRTGRGSSSPPPPSLPRSEGRAGRSPATGRADGRADF